MPVLHMHRMRLLTPVLALLCILHTVICVSSLHLQYLVNDDTGIIAFITGGYTVPYVGVLLSSVLHAGYAVAPGIPWFALALYALQTLSLFVWLTLAWRIFQPWWLAAACSLALLGCYLPFVVSVDFTATSILLCTSAITWACLEVMEPRPGRWRLLWPGFVFMLGMLVRPQVAPGALAYSLPLALVAALAGLRGHSWRDAGRRLALPALIFFLPAALDYAVDAAWRHYTLTPQEAGYTAFNAAGGGLDHISMRRRVAILRDDALLASVHMTQRDYQYFISWRFLDERIYTPEALQTLWIHAPLPDLSLKALLKVVSRRLPPGNMLVLMLLVCLPYFVISAAKRAWESLWGCLVPVYGLSLTAFMYLDYAFIERLEQPFETGLGLAALFLAGWLAIRAEAASRRLLPFAAGLSFLTLFIAAGFSVHDVLHDQVQIARRDARLAARVDNLNSHFAGSTILLQPHALDLNESNPLKPPELRFQPINLGWNTFSPRFYQQISTLGIQHGYELIDALVDRPNAYILGNQDWCESMLIYAANYPQRHIEVAATEPKINDLPLYRLTGGKPR